jgi:trehalose-6-phosphate hydrolase
LAATPGAGTPRASSIICTCSPEQADLNWENPAVRAELKKVCEFWADRGVDGLRLDVVNLISKDQISRTTTRRWPPLLYRRAARSRILQEMSRDVFTPRNLMTVGEMSSTSLETASSTPRWTARAVDDL